MKKYPRLILLFTAILVFMCRCNFPDDKKTIVYSDNTYDGCTGFTDIDLQSTADKSGYTCFLTCPDGSTVSYDIFSTPVFGQKLQKGELQAKYCKAGAAATATVTATLTQTPVGPAPVGGTSPLLSGNVTACSLKDGYINFRLVDNAPAITGSELLVTINGVKVNCTVPPNNLTILSCTLPAGITFPTDVKVAIGDSVANQFSYNGDECLYVEPTNTPKPDAPSAPAATPTPTL